MKPLRTTLFLMALALVGLLVPAPRHSEGSELRAKMDSLAKKVAEFVKGKDQTSVAMSEIIGPPDHPSSSGPGIQAILASGLKKEGVEVNQKAAYSIEGK